MHKMEELKEMLCEELDKIAKKGELSAGSLDVVDKLTHSIKSIATIMAMEEAEGGSSYEGGGYSGARGGGRGRGARRDSMGRYSREGGNSYEGGSYAGGGGGSYAGGQSNRGGGGGSYARGRGYSRDDAREELMENLHELMQSTDDDRTRKMIQKWIEQAEREA